MCVTTKQVLLSTETNGKEVVPHANSQSQGWDLAAWSPLVAGGRSSAKVSGHVLLRWLISVHPVLTLPAAGSQAWCSFPLPRGKFVTRLEAEAV